MRLIPWDADAKGAIIKKAAKPPATTSKTTVIPIQVDLQQRLGRSETDRKYDSDAKIGVVTYRDGQVFYNGKPLQGGQDKAKLAAACKRLLNRSK